MTPVSLHVIEEPVEESKCPLGHNEAGGELSQTGRFFIVWPISARYRPHYLQHHDFKKNRVPISCVRTKPDSGYTRDSCLTNLR